MINDKRWRQHEVKFPTICVPSRRRLWRACRSLDGSTVSIVSSQPSQQPQYGFPLHSDGNKMWLTTRHSTYGDQARCWRVRRRMFAWGLRYASTVRWKKGECLLYDTTYEHETFNEESEDEERVVLHVVFFNTITMTKVEIDSMRYIYKIREDFMRAEGVAKVGAQIL
mmetsp:Transcript_13806/g.20571  ORF Transcript_13806/g.20571 Transcript_13806/m.20571 type:complete len:168 (+) Transcript_13806:628-1131(+)